MPLTLAFNALTPTSTYTPPTQLGIKGLHNTLRYTLNIPSLKLCYSLIFSVLTLASEYLQVTPPGFKLYLHNSRSAIVAPPS